MMKSTIGRKILILIFIPFLIIFGVLSAYIAHTMTQYFTNWTELELKGISDINSAQLEGKIDSVRITVLSAANTLEKADTQSPDARKQVEETVLSMFVNESVYNAWIAYEPNAFDGKDAEHTTDYPGAPSGRFMLSFVAEDGTVIVAPDMDEATIDDPGQSPWYAIPRDENHLYIDVANSSIENLYDYGIGGEPVYTLSIVSPLTRDGQVIGCVGADVIFDTMTFGIDNAKNATVAVFYPDGRVFYAEDIRFAEESIDTLRFIEKDRIKQAFAESKSIFLPDEYCPFFDENAFTYLHPVRSGYADQSSLFLYVALPRTEALDGLKPILALMAGVALAILAVLFIVFAYAVRKISKPIRLLTLAADAISQGDLNAEIAPFTDSKDEIGLLSRSLHRMVEQLRVYIISLKQSQEEKSVHAQIRDCVKEDDAVCAANMILAMLCKRFGFHMASAVGVSIGSARVLSRYANGHVSDAAGFSSDFLYHMQAEAMLKGKKLIFLNQQAISWSGAQFFNEETLCACIAPLWADEVLTGYLIFENNTADNPIDAGAEALFIYTAEAFADLLHKQSNRDAYPDYGAESQPDVPPDPDAGNTAYEDETPPETVLLTLRKVQDLDADSAIAAMGGLIEVYEQSVRLLTRLLPESICNLNRYLEEDIHAFAIEIHGLKGSLNNIGAYTLGREASRLEQAAKSGDSGYCGAHFPSMKVLLEKFHGDLDAVFSDETVKPPGDPKALADALQKAGEAAAAFDSLEALDAVRPLMELSFDAETEALLIEITRSLEVFECEKALESINELSERNQK